MQSRNFRLPLRRSALFCEFTHTDVAGQPVGQMFKYEGSSDCLFFIMNYNHWGSITVT